MTPSFTQELLAARASGQEALKALAEKHLPLVGAMVKRFPPGYGPPEELYQQGVIGLMKALRRFDPDRGTAFSTYAAAMILGEMRMLRRLDAPIHLPRTSLDWRRRIRQAETALTHQLGRKPTVSELASSLQTDAAELMLRMERVSVSSMDAPSPGGTPFAELLPDPQDWQRRIELRDILSRLPQKDRQLILLRHRVGMTQTQAGQRLGMTQMQVSRREAIIRTLLRRSLAE